MNLYKCTDCRSVRENKKKVSPKLCLSCYLKRHRRTEPLRCGQCGKKLHPSNSKIKLCRPCFIKSNSTKFKEVDRDEKFGNWLAGFVDGEGNFQCHKNGKGGFVFRINLREDDVAILRIIRTKLGTGKLFFRDVRKNMVNWKPRYQSTKMRNQYTYAVNSVYDLVNTIVPFFDRYELRARKRLQYRVWKKKLLSKYAYLKGGGVGESR